jgi:hypothetical protein
MAEIEFRFPSAIPYAYVGFKGTLQEAGELSPEMLAALFANAFDAFQKAEKAAALAIIQGSKVGDSVTVGGLEFTKHSESPFEKSNLDHDEAKVALEVLGATEIENVNAPPWERPVEAKSKPWEAKKPVPAAPVDLKGW